MPPIFRYRYVDFGTSFTGDPSNRGLESSAESPGTLFANELATDVGSTCWGANEPLPIIDYHFLHDAQFPSASAAVLHKAGLIRERFAHQELVWLVTHREPDFDAFCSMYLARWITEHPNAPADWPWYGLHPDGWLDVPGRSRIDWFNPDFTAVAAEHRWALLLASYASLLESRHHISCPRQRALRSVLYAALKRGRDYLNETSGATELFDEVKSILQHRQLNPAIDSVLEDSTTFAPEVAMLDREAEAYQRDIARARWSVVYLPESEAPSPDFFKDPRHVAFHEQRRASDLDAEHLLLADTFRIPTDGIYLRDPECLLFKEWARLDLENSSLGAGFEFTAAAYSNGRPEAAANKTDYEFSIDPERANGRHLYTVWSRLQTQEVEALREHKQDIVAVHAGAHGASSEGAATLGSLLADPWTGGQSKFGNAVGTPHRGTLIAPAGVRSDLRDDPVSEAVRTELEGSIYSAVSLVTGPQVTVFDLAAEKEVVDIAPQRYDLNSPLAIPAPPEGYFRFAAIRLRHDVPIAQANLARQIGETLWQVLYPEMPGSTPSDFADRHLLVTASWVGVWADRGMAIAHKQEFAAGGAPEHPEAELRAAFISIISLARDVDRLTARWTALSQHSADGDGSSAVSHNTSELQAIVAAGDALAARAVGINHSLTLPDRDLFRRFCEAIHVDQLIATVRELAHAASERLRQHAATEQEKRADLGTGEVAGSQKKMQWLQVFLIGFLAIGVIDILTRQVSLDRQVEETLLLLGGPLFIGFVAWVTKPWRRRHTPGEAKDDQPAWILIAVAAACVVAWIAGLFQLWSN